jgi:O-methyltransferase involved in polyketide biosynthesis
MSQALAHLADPARHRGECWYTARKPAWMAREQLRCLTRSPLYESLAGHSKLALVCRIAWRWRRYQRELRSLAAVRPPGWLAIMKDFTMFAAGYTELRKLLGRERACELYSEMFLTTGEMEMGWLWPAALPLADLTDYWIDYLRAYERLGAHVLGDVSRGAGGELARVLVCGSAFHELLCRLGCPELSPLVHRMEVAALERLGRAHGVAATVDCSEQKGQWICTFVLHAPAVSARAPEQGPPMQLSPLEETAWLTVHCHSVAGARYGLDKEFADWMIGRVGRPSFADGLAWRTVDGVAVRSALIDACVASQLQRCRDLGQTLAYWSLGAGFDYRWDRFRDHMGGTIRQYLEFDRPSLLATKAELLRDSPFAARYAAVEQRPGDLRHVDLPATEGPVLVVLEGVIDYLGREDKLRLLAAIKERAPGAIVVMDAMNAWAVAQNNRRSTAATGSSSVGFSWAPADVETFYQHEAGYQLRSLQSIFRALLVRKSRLLRFLPLPAKIEKCSCLLTLAASP